MVSQSNKISLLVAIADTPESQSIIESLEKEGVVVHWEKNLDGFQERISSGVFDGCLLHHDLSPNALTTIRFVRRHSKDARIPLILLIDRTREVSFKKLLNTGVDDILRSPFNLEILLGRLKLIIRKKKTLQLALENEQTARFMVRTLTHDLSNPLTILNMTVQKCKSLSDSEKMDKQLGNLEKYLGRIQETLKSIRESSKEQSLTKKIEAVQISRVVDQVIEDFQAKIRKKKLDVQVLWKTDAMQAIAWSDKRILRDHVLSNIFSNAIKFSQPGSKITVSVACTELGLMLSIEDQGIGMPKALMDELFDFSSKTSRPGTLKESGTGHGMPLMKSYLEKVGGHLTLSSQIQESGKPSGTVFNILLPLESKTQEELSQSDPAKKSA